MMHVAAFSNQLEGVLRMAENRESNKKSWRDLSVTVDVDVSEALTGLKAVQREAKEAVKALKELDATKSLNTVNWNNIEDYSREELIEELERRGIREKIHVYTLREENDPLIIGGNCKVITIG